MIRIVYAISKVPILSDSVVALVGCYPHHRCYIPDQCVVIPWKRPPGVFPVYAHLAADMTLVLSGNLVMVSINIRV